MPRPTHSRVSFAVAQALLIALAVALVAAAGTTASVALAASRTYRNDEFRIAEFVLPRGWTSSPQPGYPRLLLLATAPAGNDTARLLLGVQKVVAGATAIELAADARVVLLKQGYGAVRVTPQTSPQGRDDRARIDAVTDDGKKILRQCYVVDGDTAVVITMMVPLAKGMREARNFESDFQLAADSLAMSPQPPASSPITAPTDAGT